MGTDRYWEAQSELQQCPAKLAAANARIVELERESAALRARVEATDRVVAGMTRARDAMLKAQAADEEQVRSVVREEAADSLLRAGVGASSDRLLLSREIADRVAKQLASATAVRLSAVDHTLIDAGLGVLTSDYNDVPHDKIAELRERLAAVRP